MAFDRFYDERIELHFFVFCIWLIVCTVHVVFYGIKGMDMGMCMRCIALGKLMTSDVAVQKQNVSVIYYSCESRTAET